MSNAETKKKLILAYVLENFSAVEDLQAADFINFDSLYTLVGQTFGDKCIDRFDLNSELMKIFKYEAVENMGNVWLIARINK